MKRQFEVAQNNIRNQYAQQASLYERQMSNQSTEAARQKAIEEEALKQYNALSASPAPATRTSLDDINKAWASSPLQTQIFSAPIVGAQNAGRAIGNFFGGIGNWIGGR
jgi:hypothetical protein